MKNPRNNKWIRGFFGELILERTVAHTARGGDGRQEGRERGYYYLHRNLNNPFLHTLVFLN